MRSRRTERTYNSAQQLQTLAAKLEELERKLASHDQAIAGILHAIRELMRPPEAHKRPIGFVTAKEEKRGG